MKFERIAKMVEKISQDEEGQPLVLIDQAVDSMVSAMEQIDNSLKEVKTENNTEKEAVKNIRDILETALVPYITDIITEMEKFEGE